MRQETTQQILNNLLSAWDEIVSKPIDTISLKQCKHKFTSHRLCDNSKEYYCSKCGLVKS